MVFVRGTYSICLIWWYSSLILALNREGPEYAVKSIFIDIDFIEKEYREHFMTRNTIRFLNLTGLPSNFLNKNIPSWSPDGIFNKC